MPTLMRNRAGGGGANAFEGLIAARDPAFWMDMVQAASPIVNRGYTQALDPAINYPEVGTDTGNLTYEIASPTGLAVNFPGDLVNFTGGTWNNQILTNTQLGSWFFVFRTSNTTDGRWLFEIANGGDEDSFGRVAIFSDSTIRVGVQRDFSSNNEFTLRSATPANGGQQIVDGNWHSGAWVKHAINGGSDTPKGIYRLYLDAIRQDTVAAAVEVDDLTQDLWPNESFGASRTIIGGQHHAGNNLNIGNGGFSFDGDIDQLIWMEDVLDDADVLELHNALGI